MRPALSVRGCKPGSSPQKLGGMWPQWHILMHESSNMLHIMFIYHTNHFGRMVEVTEGQHTFTPPKCHFLVRKVVLCGLRVPRHQLRTGARRATCMDDHHMQHEPFLCEFCGVRTRPAPTSPRRPRGPTPTSAQKKLHVFSMLKTKLRLNRPSTGSKAKRRHVLATCFKFNKHTLLTPC